MCQAFECWDFEAMKLGRRDTCSCIGFAAVCEDLWGLKGLDLVELPGASPGRLPRTPTCQTVELTNE
jgi:hypothetical protein